MGDSEGDRAQWVKRVKDLEQERLFHNYRDKTEKLKMKLNEGLSAARTVLKQYQDLLTTAKSLQEMLEKSFAQALDRAVPPLEKMLTEVYQRLTRQPSYDLVKL